MSTFRVFKTRDKISKMGTHYYKGDLSLLSDLVEIIAVNDLKIISSFLENIDRGLAFIKLTYEHIMFLTDVCVLFIRVSKT